MIFKIFFFICLIVYIISLIEVIGSYCVTQKEQGNSTDVNLIFAIFCPPVAPFVAIAIYFTAKDLYDKHTYNTYNVDESFYGYVIHGFKSINAWSFKKEKK